MFNKTALSTIAILTAGLIAGCTDSGSDTTDQGVGSAIFNLSAEDANDRPVCLMGTIGVNEDDDSTSGVTVGALVSTINQTHNCSSNLVQVGLLNGDYVVPQQTVNCDYDDDDDGDPTDVVHTTCTIQQFPFSVTMGGFTDIPVSVIIHTVDGDVPAVAGAGIANISIADNPVVAMHCSADDEEVCNEGGETCWEINDIGPACYQDCTFNLVNSVGGTCTDTSLNCVPLFDGADNEDGLLPIGQELAATPLPGACMAID